jgi:hypothetical protein
MNALSPCAALKKELSGGFFIYHKKNNMTSKVRVTADSNGNIIGISKNNPEFGYVRVEQQVMQVNHEGWLRNQKRSSLIKGKVSDLLAADFKEGQELPGRIVVRESHSPFNPENPDRDLKIAGDSGVICRVDDQPIYRQSFYTTDNNAQDDLIMHNNTEEIREVQAATRMIQGLQHTAVDQQGALKTVATL